MSDHLKPWARELADEWDFIYQGGNCSCHLSAPCSSCTHPGNPLALECTDGAWGFDADEEVDASMRWINSQIARDAKRHIAEMKAQWAKVHSESQLMEGQTA